MGVDKGMIRGSVLRVMELFCILLVSTCIYIDFEIYRMGIRNKLVLFCDNLNNKIIKKSVLFF